MLSCYTSYNADGSGRDLLFPERLTRDRLEGFKRKYGELYYLNYENRGVGAGTTAFDMRFCGRFRLDGTDLIFTTDDNTQNILDVIASGQEVAGQKRRPKTFFEMTPEERTSAWNESMANWHRDKISQIERC